MQAKDVMERVNAWVLVLFKVLVLLYRWCLSPWLGQNCRYVPSCSEYALDALTLHGPWRGSWLAVRRIFRCNPWVEGGYDPVPGSRCELQSCKAHCTDGDKHKQV